MFKVCFGSASTTKKQLLVQRQLGQGANDNGHLQGLRQRSGGPLRLFKAIRPVSNQIPRVKQTIMGNVVTLALADSFVWRSWLEYEDTNMETRIISY